MTTSQQPRIASQYVRPLTAAERIALVDVLRGVAILGVLVAYTLWNLGSPPVNTWSRLDHVIDTVGEALVDTKFITIFAFLFGVGTAQQWRRTELDDKRRAAIHLRRMSFLFVAGLVHAVFLRNGDILAPYAVLGFVLFAARGRSSRTLIVAAVILALVPYATQVAAHAMGLAFPDRPTGSDTGKWSLYWKDNFAWVRYWYLTLPLLSWPRVLALMLAGVLADRARLMPRIASERRLALRVLIVAVPFAIVLKATSVLLPAHWPAAHASLTRDIVLNQIYFLAAWALAAAYIAAFALLCQRPQWPARLHWLRAVGRMAFTNYLLQALIVVPVCLAFDLFDAITPTRGLLLAIGVMAIEIPFSVWWLARFEYGPVEFLWRTATYGSSVALRRR
jgi:uncharacterized protein